MIALRLHARLRLSAALALAFVALVACGSSSIDEGSSPAAPDGGTNATGSDAAADGSVAANDASTSGDADAGASPSRCTVDGGSIACEHDETTLSDRIVAHAVPAGVAPAKGWKAVVFFQGSLVAGHTAFAADESQTFGRYQLTTTFKALLDRGYAIVAPDAAGGSVWQSNIPPYTQAWSGCDDDVFMQSFFTALGAGTFGPIDVTHLYAMGISSGGFMTSRMAVSYAGKFRALAVHSGSYATCSTLCLVPTPLPTDHPPTLFLRGESDALVPASSVQPYLDALLDEAHEAKLVTDPDAGHEWLPIGATEIPAWFDAHL